MTVQDLRGKPAKPRLGGQSDMKRPLSRKNERLAQGTRLKLQNEHEGWLGASEVISGVVVEEVGCEHRSKPWYQSNPWYLVKLDEPLEFQESGHDTPSGLLLVSYSSLIVSCRWGGVEINRREPVSVFLCLLPEGQDPAQHLGSVTHPDVWASCVILDGAA